jgi:hypothetical protein
MPQESLQEHLRRKLAEVLRLPPEERIPALKRFLEELRRLELQHLEEADETEVRAIEEQARAAADLRRMVETRRQQDQPRKQEVLEVITEREAPKAPPLPRERLEYWTTERLHAAAESLYDAQRRQGTLTEEQRRTADYIGRIQQYKASTVERGEYDPGREGARALTETGTILERIHGREERKYRTD